jgi:hypothetical protein
MKNSIKRAKYLNKKIECDGYTFDSKKEFSTYLKFKKMKESGIIKEMEIHKRFDLVDTIYVNQDHAIYSGKKRDKNDLCLQQKMFYKCDFFIVWKNDKIEVIDVKGYDKKTKQFRHIGKYELKKKLMKYLYNIEIREV